MKLSFDDTKFIRAREGFSLKAYPDPVSHGDPWTISWGLTGPWVVPGLTITQQEAEDRFMDRINSTCTELDKYIHVPITKNMYIALLSLTWNEGVARVASSTLLKKLNANQKYSAADHFQDFKFSNHKVIPGLVTRREEEKALFLTP